MNAHGGIGRYDDFFLERELLPNLGIQYWLSFYIRNALAERRAGEHETVIQTMNALDEGPNLTNMNALLATASAKAITCVYELSIPNAIVLLVLSGNLVVSIFGSNPISIRRETS